MVTGKYTSCVKISILSSSSSFSSRKKCISDAKRGPCKNVLWLKSHSICCFILSSNATMQGKMISCAHRHKNNWEQHIQQGSTHPLEDEALRCADGNGVHVAWRTRKWGCCQHIAQTFTKPQNKRNKQNFGHNSNDLHKHAITDDKT